jgi:hypothetical protein
MDCRVKPGNDEMESQDAQNTTGARWAPVVPFPHVSLHELALSTVTTRRFCDQHEMSLQTATGRSLP